MTMMPMDPVFSQKFQMPQPKAGGGMFGGGPSWTNAIQAAIGGYLAGRGMPGGHQLLDQVRQRQLMSQQIAMMQQQRQADLEDYETKLGIASKFKGPDIPDIQQRIEVLNGISPGLGKTYAENYARNGGGMGMNLFTDPSTGQKFMMPNLPQIGSEVDDPRNPGGPTPQASGGFPPFGY